MKWELLCKRTDFPKLGYIIHRLKEAGIPYKLSDHGYFHKVALAIDFHHGLCYNRWR